MAKKAINFSNSILCEYVALGNNNKHTLVNVFSGDIITREFPFEIQLGLFVVLTDANIELLQMEFVINGETVFIANAGPIIGTGPLAVSSFTIKVEKPDTVLELVLSAKDHKKTVALRKKILQGEITLAPTIASQRPS